MKEYDSQIAGFKILETRATNLSEFIRPELINSTRLRNKNLKCACNVFIIWPKTKIFQFLLETTPKFYLFFFLKRRSKFIYFTIIIIIKNSPNSNSKPLLNSDNCLTNYTSPLTQQPKTPLTLSLSKTLQRWLRYLPCCMAGIGHSSFTQGKPSHFSNKFNHILQLRLLQRCQNNKKILAFAKENRRNLFTLCCNIIKFNKISYQEQHKTGDLMKWIHI